MSNTIFVTLTEDEIRERGKVLARLVSSVNGLELEKKEVAKDLNDKIKGFKEEIDVLARAIRTGQEEREADLLPGIRKIGS